MSTIKQDAQRIIRDSIAAVLPDAAVKRALEGRVFPRGVTLVAILTLVPKIKSLNFKKPMLLSAVLFAASQALLLMTDMLKLSGMAAWPLLIICVALEAMAVAMLSPLMQSILFINADEDERARICGMIYATVALMVCIFPTVIGYLADLSLYLPFSINIGLFAAMGVCTVAISRLPAPGER